jgi:hypothetical protein
VYVCAARATLNGLEKHLWELDPSEIVLDRKVGAGASGEVCVVNVGDGGGQCTSNSPAMLVGLAGNLGRNQGGCQEAEQGSID